MKHLWEFYCRPMVRAEAGAGTGAMFEAGENVGSRETWLLLLLAPPPLYMGAAAICGIRRSAPRGRLAWLRPQI